jgi:hypothetical protein
MLIQGLYSKKNFIGRAKIGITALPKKFCCLLVLWGIQGVPRDFYFRLALIPVRIKSVTGAGKKGDHAKNFQVEQKGGRVHPAIRNIL